MAKGSNLVFKTHSNYVSAIRYVACGEDVSYKRECLRTLALKIKESGWLKRVEKGFNVDITRLRRRLINAWSVETVYKISDELIKEDDLVRLSNNWLVVQCYYIFYYVTQIFALCEGYPIPTTHAQIHRTYYLIMSKKSSSLLPWSIWYDYKGFHNLPRGFKPDDTIHSWRKVNKSTALSLVCKALRTTREEYIEEAIKRRKERLSRQGSSTIRLKKEARVQTERRVRPVTLINYIYRLKRTTLYERSSMLSIGPENMYQSLRFREDLLCIIDLLLLMAELLALSAVGERVFSSWCKEVEFYKPSAFNKIGPLYRKKTLFDCGFNVV